ncbi:MAG: ketoacyl-ACP synthase III [Bdellovibrionaceae bacterium]|nr:ketoacyl-ACP synthase III [Pseudobdellovibrionaceae bacterium]MBX3034314.1 ketoacyl-ACP synthase III [Pseudobdellovibrionaceae bacterium]
MTPPYRSRVAGTGSYLPEKLLTNADLEKMVDTNDQWIVERTGIRRRHIAAPHEATSDLSLVASQRALADAGLTAQDLDMIIVSTVSGDQVMPSTACVLQSKLGCRQIMAFDMLAACSGFVYGLSVADQFIRTGMYKNILVVGAEVLHRFVNYKDRETCILFGDGAGAWIVSRAEEGDRNVIMSSHLHAEGALGDLFVLAAGGSRMPLTQQVLADEAQFVRMKGREIFKNAVRTMTACCHEALEANGTKPSEVDWLVPHQANVRILQSVADHFEFPHEKVIMSVDETGNTSAASIPLAFQIGREDGRIQRGQLILLAAFGAGLTSGSLLMRY